MNRPGGPFRVDIVDDYAAALADLRAVREPVFVQEQQVPIELEWDELDPQCVHAIARDAGGSPIGTARLTPQHTIGRMAVLPPWRSAGVGGALLQALLRQARLRGCTGITLHAQVGAVDFYLRHGFIGHGERFQEAGIEHQSMRLALDQPQAVPDRAAAVAVTADLVDGARRRIRIRSRDLDPGLFDQATVLAALRRMATGGHPGTAIEILLHDAAAVQRAHAPLLALAQRLPTIFTFREVVDQVDRAFAPAFLVNDAGGYYFRSLGHRFEGEAERDAAGRARQLVATFGPVWERSRPCTELRALGL